MQGEGCMYYVHFRLYTTKNERKRSKDHAILVASIRLPCMYAFTVSKLVSLAMFVPKPHSKAIAINRNRK